MRASSSFTETWITFSFMMGGTDSRISVNTRGILLISKVQLMASQEYYFWWGAAGEEGSASMDGNYSQLNKQMGPLQRSMES